MELTAEKDLVVLAQRGDEKAFEALLDDAVPKLKNLLTSQYKLQPTDIDEIIQASMIKVWKKIGAFRSESSFVTWFYIILRNEAIDFIKKRNVLEGKEVPAHHTYTDGDEDGDYEHLTVEQTFEETAATLLEKRELMGLYHQMIHEVLNELSSTHGQIIRMAIEGEKTYKQISDELGIPIGTVMSRLFFARKRAQQLIIQYAKRNAIQLTGVGRCIESTIPEGSPTSS